MENLKIKEKLSQKLFMNLKINWNREHKQRTLHTSHSKDSNIYIYIYIYMNYRLH